jgi:hypothetical protein
MPAAERGAEAGLPGALRGGFERIFGHDFGHVRVHTDASAAERAERFAAHAFTFGSDIYFAQGAWSPATLAGQRLIAHELAHVVQQGQIGPAVQMKRAGGCATALEHVDDQRDENSRAGLAAHEQIQAFLAGALGNELRIPRATKDKKRRCPGPNTPDGRADLCKWDGTTLTLGEIKPHSSKGREAAIKDLKHYFRRIDELAARITGKGRCKADDDGAADRDFDNARLGGTIQSTGKVDTFPLDEHLPVEPEKAYIGPFSRDPKKDLYAHIMKESGGVLYWCTKRDRKRKKKHPKETQPRQEVAVDKRPQKAVRLVDRDGVFREIMPKLPGGQASEGDHLVVAVPQQLYNGVYDAITAQRNIRMMQVDLKDYPIYGAQMGTFTAGALIALGAEFALVALVLPEVLAVEVPVVVAEAAATETVVTTGATATTTAAVTTEVGTPAIEFIDLAAEGVEAADMAGTAAADTAAAADAAAAADTAAATSTAAATAPELMSFWTSAAAQNLAERSAYFIGATLLAAGFSEKNAAAAAGKALDNRAVVATIDVKDTTPSVGQGLKIASSPYVVIAVLKAG